METRKKMMQVYLESDEPCSESDEACVYLLEMIPGSGWSVWQLVAGAKMRAVIRDQDPVSCFNEMLELPIFPDVHELQQAGHLREVAYQDWDSGGPGAGAGRVSVYRLGDVTVGVVYFILHDAGISQGFDNLKDACEEGWIEKVNDATRAIWVDDEG